MFATREIIDEMYETKNILPLYGLSRIHFLFLFRIAEGRGFSSIADELEKTERTLYFWKDTIVKKFKVASFFQVMYEFGRHSN